MQFNEEQAKWVAQRDRAHARFGALIAAAGIALGALLGWNFHDNEATRAQYIADLPSCNAEK